MSSWFNKFSSQGTSQPQTPRTPDNFSSIIRWSIIGGIVLFFIILIIIKVESFNGIRERFSFTPIVERFSFNPYIENVRAGGRI